MITGNTDDTFYLIENQYYTAKNPDLALQHFNDILLRSDISNSIWHLKSLKQLAKIYIQKSLYTEALNNFDKFLNDLKNHSLWIDIAEKEILSIVKILPNVQLGYQKDLDFLEAFYNSIIAAPNLHQNIKFHSYLQLGEIFLVEKRVLGMHLICRNLGAICGSTDEESDHSNYISAHEAAEHRKSWQLLDFYALKCRYLLDLRPSKTYTDLCITMYYKMKNIKIQVPHHKAVATIWLYAAKTLLIQEDIFFKDKEFQVERRDETAQSFFLACFQSAEVTTQPNIQLCCLKYLLLIAFADENQKTFITGIMESSGFSKHPEIVVLNSLWQSFINWNITAFDTLLRKSQTLLEKESLLLYYLGEASLYLKRTIIFDHVKNLFKNLASDKHVTQMQDLSVLLHIDSHSLESILAQFFVARKCAGFIDSVKGEVTLFKLECLR